MTKQNMDALRNRDHEISVELKAFVEGLVEKYSIDQHNLLHVVEAMFHGTLATVQMKDPEAYTRFMIEKTMELQQEERKGHDN